jgi:hypothetical protein
MARSVFRLDVQTDGVVEVCQLCAPCTRSTRHAQELRSAARLLDTVEPELVPTVLQVQYNIIFVCFERDIEQILTHLCT